MPQLCWLRASRLVCFIPFKMKKLIIISIIFLSLVHATTTNASWFDAVKGFFREEQAQEQQEPINLGAATSTITQNLFIKDMSSTNNPCLIISSTGLVSTSTCGGLSTSSANSWSGLQTFNGGISFTTATGTSATSSLSFGNATGTNLTIQSLTATRLLQSSAGRVIQSVADLTSWIAGTASEVTIADDGDGTLTASLPSVVDLGAASNFTSVGINFTNATGTNLFVTTLNVTNGTIGTLTVSSVVTGPLIVGGTATSTIRGDGTLTAIGGALNASGTISQNGTAVLLTGGSVSSTNITATGYLTVSGQTTLVNASGTNISASGYGLFPSLFSTSASTTNLTASGYIQSGNFPVLTTGDTKYASSSITLNIYDATTTSPYQYAKWRTSTDITLTQVSCDEFAAATSTFNLYRTTSLDSVTVDSLMVVGLPCSTAYTTSTFVTSTILAGQFLVASTTATAGTPTWSGINIYYKK